LNETQSDNEPTFDVHFFCPFLYFLSNWKWIPPTIIFPLCYSLQMVVNKLSCKYSRRKPAWNSAKNSNYTLFFSLKDIICILCSLCKSDFIIILLFAFYCTIISHHGTWWKFLFLFTMFFFYMLLLAANVLTWTQNSLLWWRVLRAVLCFLWVDDFFFCITA
jgi:hypothetical protein